jgi:CheY-like chemotaxis protein
MNTKPQVLVIDDDAVVGRSFDRVLSRQGYDVSTALTGEEALDKIGEHDYDVVFTDIKMPGMDGLEVAERIMDRCPWTPVVVITGYGTEENEARAKVLGTDGFIRKPRQHAGSGQCSRGSGQAAARQGGNRRPQRRHVPGRTLYRPGIRGGDAVRLLRHDCQDRP